MRALVLGLALVATPAWANWVFVASHYPAVITLKRDSVVINGRTRTFWDRTTSVDTGSYYLSRQTMDCDSGMVSYQSITAYDRDGNVEGSGSPHTSYVVPNSIQETEMEMVCGK